MHLFSRKERAWLRTVVDEWKRGSRERAIVPEAKFPRRSSKSSPYGSSHVIVVTFETPELLFCLPRWFPLHNPLPPPRTFSRILDGYERAFLSMEFDLAAGVGYAGFLRLVPDVSPRYVTRSSSIVRFPANPAAGKK